LSENSLNISNELPQANNQVYKFSNALKDHECSQDVKFKTVERDKFDENFGRKNMEKKKSIENLPIVNENSTTIKNPRQKCRKLI